MSAAPGHDPAIVSTFGRLVPRLLLTAVLGATAEVAAGLALAEPALVGTASLSALFGISIVLGSRLRQIGLERWEAPFLAVTVFLIGLLAAFLVPGIAHTAAMLPILSVLLLVPGRGRAAIAAIFAAALVGSGLALLLAYAPHVFPPMREPIGSVFASASLLAVALVLMLALAEFAIRATVSLDGMRRAMQSRDAAFIERTAIVASLGRLQRRDTIEATAEVIVHELRRLPEIDLAGVFACTDRDIELLAVSGPPLFPVGPGEFLPAARARHLLDRMGHGPWAELWDNDPAFEQYGAAFTATGIKGQAFAPFFDGGVLMGAVAIGTLSDAHAKHLIADLPAVAEFAATASLLLTPLLVARRQTATARASIEAIIATHAYAPVFQPIVELETGLTLGYEALTRFADGRRPDLVFGVAADVDLGTELELQTLEAAVRAARALPGGAWLSLNVSPTLVVQADGLAGILSLRDRPVVLEITEHVAIEDYRAVRSAIDRLGPGVRVAVDDAGAGIANFSHLVELRPSMVKVDAGLIRDLDTDLARQAVVVGLVHFAAKAGCEVIAEGIETEAERATAHALGVTQGQGFLMARPAPSTTFTAEANAHAPRVDRRIRRRLAPAS